MAASGKLALLDRMMGRLHAEGHRVLLYSQFTRTLDVLEDWLAGRRWGYERIDGARENSEIFFSMLLLMPGFGVCEATSALMVRTCAFLICRQHAAVVGPWVWCMVMSRDCQRAHTALEHVP